MSEETEVQQEKAIRLNIKRNFKGEAGGEITVRADTTEEIKKLLDEIRPIFKEELKNITEFN